MIEKTFLGLYSEQWWEIYEAENPLVEVLRKVKIVFHRRSNERRARARRFEGWFQSY